MNNKEPMRKRRRIHPECSRRRMQNICERRGRRERERRRLLLEPIRQSLNRLNEFDGSAFKRFVGGEMVDIISDGSRRRRRRRRWRPWSVEIWHLLTVGRVVEHYRAGLCLLGRMDNGDKRIQSRKGLARPSDAEPGQPGSTSGCLSFSLGSAMAIKSRQRNNCPGSENTVKVQSSCPSDLSGEMRC